MVAFTEEEGQLVRGAEHTTNMDYLKELRRRIKDLNTEVEHVGKAEELGVQMMRTPEQIAKEAKEAAAAIKKAAEEKEAKDKKAAEEAAAKKAAEEKAAAEKKATDEAAAKKAAEDLKMAEWLKLPAKRAMLDLGAAFSYSDFLGRDGWADPKLDGPKAWHQ